MLLNNKTSAMRTTPITMASVTISHPTADLSLPSPTNIEGITKPKATPIGFAEEPIVVAPVLYVNFAISGRNQNVANFAGALSRKGCPIAANVCPIKIQ